MPAQIITGDKSFAMSSAQETDHAGQPTNNSYIHAN